MCWTGRPVNASEALAHQYLHGQKPFQFGSRHQQQGYVDARLDNTEVGESARPAARPNDPEEDETLAEEFADRPSEGRRVRFGTAEEPDVEEMPPSRMTKSRRRCFGRRYSSRRFKETIEPGKHG